MSIEPGHLSHSQITTFAECGERYRLQRVLGKREEPSWWLVAGKTIHAITEDIDRARVYGQEAIFSIDEMARHYWPIFKAEEDPNGDAQWRQSRNEDEDWWLSQISTHVSNYLGWSTHQTIWTEGEILGIELPLDVMVQDYRIKGYVDRVVIDDAGQLGVVDIKTGRNAPKSSQQLGTYAVMMEASGLPRPSWGGYFMTRTVKARRKADEDQPGRFIGPFDLNGWTVETVGRMAGALSRAQEHDVYMANTSSWCSSCGVNKYCFAYQASNPKPVSISLEA